MEWALNAKFLKESTKLKCNFQRGEIGGRGGGWGASYHKTFCCEGYAYLFFEQHNA